MNVTLKTQILILAEHLRRLNWRMATAESCTGGGIGYYLTELSGASEWFAGGVMAYNNAVKQDALGVSAETLIEQGAVSEAVVTQMARGVFRLMSADCSVAVSGVAGPTGGTQDKPVGTVCFAWSWRDAVGNTLVRTHRTQFIGDRSEVRMQTVLVAIEGLIELCDLVWKKQPISDNLILSRTTRMSNWV